MVKKNVFIFAATHLDWCLKKLKQKLLMSFRNGLKCTSLSDVKSSHFSHTFLVLPIRLKLQIGDFDPLTTLC